MRRRGGDEHDLVAGEKPSDAVDNGDVLKRPARAGFIFDPFKFGFGHSRIMLERHGGDPVVTPQAANSTDEKRDCANSVIL